MEFTIHYHDQVWTKDDKKLGVVHHIYHRPEGVDPAVKLYDSYMHVEDFELGLVFYIPTTFIAAVDESHQRVNLTTTQKQVLNNTWNRKPDFVFAGKAEVQKLEPVSS